MRLHGLWLCYHRRLAGVAPLPDFWVKRDLPYVWNLEILAYLLAPALPKEVDLLAAVRALQVAHVFNDSDYRNVELVEHAYRLDGHARGNVLRRSDYQYAGDGYCLRYRQRRVARAGRKIDNQVVKLAPVDVCQKLLDDSGNDRTPVNAGLLRLFVEKAHRNNLDAFNDWGLDLVVENFRRRFQPQHQWNAWPVNVSVKQTTFAPVFASASARFTETVVLPTPPLPLATATMFLTPGKSSSIERALPSMTLAVTLMLNSLTPRPAMAALTSRSMSLLNGHAGVVSSRVKATLLSLIDKSFIIPIETMSLCSSGSTTFFSELRT